MSTSLVWVALVSSAAVIFEFLRWFVRPLWTSIDVKDVIRKRMYFLDPHTLDDPNNAFIRFPWIWENAASCSLSVIIPAYNESIRIIPMLEETLAFLSAREESGKNFSFEVIVVDDGSSDDTTAVALKYSDKYSTSKFRVLTLKQNVGKGGAIQHGVLRSRGRYILMADADGATKFSEYDKLEAALMEVDADGLGVCVGSRYHLEEQALAERKWYRNITMVGFHMLVSAVGIGFIRDTQCGFKLFTRRSARWMFYNQRLSRWAFDVEVLKLAHRFGFPIKEVAVKWTEIPGSKLSVINASLTMFRDLFWLQVCHLSGIWGTLVPPNEEAL